jgi:putative PIN family toxin of toxin-antitoxin system
LLDTNVLASAIATRGLCAELFEAVLHDHELLTCDAVVRELHRVLEAKLRVASTVAADFCTLLRSEAEIIATQLSPGSSIEDPDDAPIIACALAGRADLFVTGDKALLGLKTIDGMPVISPRELWDRLALSSILGRQQ